MLEPPINHEICDFCNGGSLIGHLLRQRFKVILDMGVEPKIWQNPQIIHFHRVFHEIQHPFWG